MRMFDMVMILLIVVLVLELRGESPLPTIHQAGNVSQIGAPLASIIKAWPRDSAKDIAALIKYSAPQHYDKVTLIVNDRKAGFINIWGVVGMLDRIPAANFTGHYIRK